MREYRKQEGPFCVQIEFSEGCNLYCTFCGLQGIREKQAKNYKFMTEDTLRSTMEQITALKWNPRIEFAMHGEPTMHPDYVSMVKIARECAPNLQLMMTSNAGGLFRKPGLQQNILNLFNAGLNILALDDYEGVGFVPKIREMKEQIAAFNISVHEYPKDPAGNPHRRRPLNTRLLSLVQDLIEASKGTHSIITNHAGSGGPLLKEPLKRRCAKPFRELGIRWDGNVAMCCNDWRGVYKCGNVISDGLQFIWNSPAMGAAREKLYAADRNFGACKGCDYTTYRDGLLPDKLGKSTLPVPDEQTELDVEKACSGAPYAAPVWRPWEKHE